MILVSRLITYAALAREESRGTHFRNDFSETIPHFNKSLDFDIKDMTNFLNNITNKTSIKTA